MSKTPGEQFAELIHTQLHPDAARAEAVAQETAQGPRRMRPDLSQGSSATHRTADSREMSAMRFVQALNAATGRPLWTDVR